MDTDAASPAPMSMSSVDQSQRLPASPSQQVTSLLLQEVVYFVSPFLNKIEREKLEELLAAHGAQRAIRAFPQGGDVTASLPTHIISRNLDIPGYKDHVARGAHIVTPEWVTRSIARKTIQNPSYYSADPSMIFSGLVFTTTGIPLSDRKMVIQGTQELGGHFTMDMTSEVTHLITVNPESSDKYRYAMDHPELGIKIVLPHWFQTCYNLRRRFPETIYLMPNPPMHDPEYVVSKADIPMDSAPQLYANSLKPVVAFLKEPSVVPSQSLVLQNKMLILAKDLFVLPDLRASFVNKIQEAGGSVLEDENEYDPVLVDIVICRYRRGHLYKKASKDGKIVASIDWLLHVLQTGALTSPMASLLHYPIPFRPIPGMSGMVMTISNYNGPIREYIKRLIVTMGAVYKPTLTSPLASEPTTHIICGDASGEKYEKGQEWNVKVVNHLWIEDCFLEWAIQSETKHIYVAFPPHSQLSFVFGTALPPELMDEWIEVADGNESDTRSDTALAPPPKQATTRTETGQESTVKVGEQSSAAGAMELDSGVHLENDLDKTESSPQGTTKKGAASIKNKEASAPEKKQSEMESSTSGVGAGGVRVVSRVRGAALEASKNLKKNVSDMNAFQQELRNEKRSPKKKRKIVDQDDDDDTARDASTEPEEDEQLAEASGEPASPEKKRRRSTTPAAKTGKRGKAAASTTAQAEEMQDVEMKEDEELQHSSPPRPSTPSKKTSQKETKDGTPSSASPKGPIRYITTGTVKLPPKSTNKLKALGITEAKSVEQCTHLVASNLVRTEKFLYALAAGKEIVNEDWLKSCVDTNQISDENKYPVKDVASEKKYKFKLADAMKRARQSKVFDGCMFYFTPNTKPKRDVLEPLVTVGGGKTAPLLQTGLSYLGEKIHRANERAKRRSSKKKNMSSPEARSGEDEEESEDESELTDDQERTIIVISNEADRDMWKPMLEAGASVYSTELVLTGLFKQELDMGATHKLA